MKLLRVSHLKIMRDIYYIAAQFAGSPGSNAITDYEVNGYPFKPSTPRDVVSFLSNLHRWDEIEMRAVEFPLAEDQFLMLGDNSAKSKDSRLWEQHGFESYVRRELLIGKAFYIYWPHSWNKLPGTKIPFPLFPNFPRMGFVR